jgi:TRAP-type mannitol/chloroaromatic compound transport system substrate-binding protein
VPDRASTIQGSIDETTLACGPVIALIAALLLSGNTFAQTTATPVRDAHPDRGPSASIYFELLKRMCDRVDRMSAGRVKMEFLPDGAVVPAFEILDAVDKGIRRRRLRMDALLVRQEPDRRALFQSDGGRGGSRPSCRMSPWIFEGGGYDLYPQALQGRAQGQCRADLRPADGPRSPSAGSRTPINSTADFKKMKYRAPPGITGEIFKEMGVSAVALPGGEIVPAAQRGVIDAARMDRPADDMNLGLQTVWKHYYLQGLHQSTDIGEILINKTVWDKLSPDLKEIIRTAAMASMMETYTYNV